MTKERTDEMVVLASLICEMTADAARASAARAGLDARRMFGEADLRESFATLEREGAAAFDGGDGVRYLCKRRVEDMAVMDVGMQAERIVRRWAYLHADDPVVTALCDFPEWVPEEDNPNILIKGRWLERGGAAFWISTAGTGKSIASLQIALCMSEGRPFARLTPIRPLNVLMIQSEDSADRVSLDREGIVAELSETMPEVDWRKTCRKVRFVKFPGKVGADFLAALDRYLENCDDKPDLIIINPFLAYIGGPVTDGAYVTPFLRGGVINRKETKGLQAILERHGCGALIFHHTPKPPSNKELDEWMKSRFPEYQGAGSADITNWGRSFVTMMRVKDHPDMVCLTAGKNGNDIGWNEIDGAKRHYLAYSNGIGVDGRGRHAWRELDADEYEELTKGARAKTLEDVTKVVHELMTEPGTYSTVGPCGLSRTRFRVAWNDITANATKYGLTCVEVTTGRGKHLVYGNGDFAMAKAVEILQNWNSSQTANGRPISTAAPVIKSQPNNRLPPTATNCHGTRSTNQLPTAHNPFRDLGRQSVVGCEGVDQATDCQQFVSDFEVRI